MATELDHFGKRYPRRTFHGRIRVIGFMEAKRRNERLLSNQTKRCLGIAAMTGRLFTKNKRRTLLLSPLNRAIRVIAFEKIEDILPSIKPYRSFLQTVGMATSPKNFFNGLEILGEIGVTRITALGSMTAPEAGWHHDGRFNVLDLISMVDIESSAEEDSERFAPYVD